MVERGISTVRPRRSSQPTGRFSSRNHRQAVYPGRPEPAPRSPSPSGEPEAPTKLTNCAPFTTHVDGLRSSCECVRTAAKSLGLDGVRLWWQGASHTGLRFRASPERVANSMLLALRFSSNRLRICTGGLRQHKVPEMFSRVASQASKLVFI